MMQEEKWILQRWVDKSDWGKGPWNHEDDRVEFHIGDYVGLALRHDWGHWLGYLGVPPSHPWSEKAKQDLPGIKCHGGITFTGRSLGKTRWTLCVEGGFRDSGIWWIGFDCFHSGDYAPAPSYAHSQRHDHYRTEQFVLTEIRGLMDQAEVTVLATKMRELKDG